MERVVSLSSLDLSEQTGPRLFQHLTLRSITLKNRIMVSPMSMYSSHEGFTDDLHLVHLGRFALGGAGLVMMEATAVARDGRITHGCNGIWLDAHIAPLKRIAGFLKSHGAVPGIQLGHSGPKGSSQRPWHGYGPLGPGDLAERREQPWTTRSASSQRNEGGAEPSQALSESEMDALVEDYRQSTRRARESGFEALELHCAHGYLLHSFLSPLVNHRSDRYGGSLENRMRFPLRVAKAVRQEWPEQFPMFVRISSVDGIGVGWSIEDSVAFATELKACGVDAIACSSGGITLPRDKVLVSREPGFQVPFAARIRKEARLPTIAVGLICKPEQADAVIAAGDADLIALGREMLVDPNWAAQAALKLQQGAGWKEWPDQFRWWLERRARQMGRSSKS